MADDGPRNTGQASSGTDVSIREYVMAMIHALDERLDERMRARASEIDGRLAALAVLAEQRAEYSDKAIDKASVSMEKRLDGMNEFRAQLKDQGVTFATRAEVETRFAGSGERMDRLERTLNDRLKSLENNKQNMDGRFTMLGLIITFIVIAINLGLSFLRVKQ